MINCKIHIYETYKECNKVKNKTSVFHIPYLIVRKKGQIGVYMRNIRRFSALLLICALAAFSLIGCKSTTDSNSVSDTTVSATQIVESTNTQNLTPTYDDEDFVSTWTDSSATHITLSNSSASVSGSGATASGSVVTITQAGTYVVSGTISEGQIVVNATDKGTVRIILNNANITNSKTAPINVIEAKKVLLTIAEGTTNTVTDKARTATADEEYSAAIYSTADMVINGSGKLTVNAGYNDGITSKDSLIMISGDLNITATDDGIIGKDLLNIYNGTLIINSGGDGLKSTYDTDTTKGDILINNGTITITSKNDAIQAENILKIEGGTFTIKTGGGSTAAKAKTESNMPNMMGKTTTTATTATTGDSDSMKALKATNYLYVSGGLFTINAQDDSLHTSGTALVSGGTFEIATGDDAIHADNLVQIDGGTINITTCYEGLEGTTITINGGDIKLVSSDDGLNASDGSSSSTGGFGGQASASTSSCKVNINGGTLYVNAGGDGLDSNGAMAMTGGTVCVDGPTDNGNGPLDYDSTFTISGGTLVAAGSSGMAQAPSTATNGVTILMIFSTAKAAKSIYTIKDSSGNTVFEYTPSKTYASVVVYTAAIKTGSAYTITNAGKDIVTATISTAITNMNESGITTGTTNGGMGGAPQGGGRVR